MKQNGFKQNRDSISDQKADTAKYGFLIGLFLNGMALIAAVISNSLIAVSDMINGFTETLSIFLTWMAMQRVAKGRNMPNYNYGEGKIENLASLGIALTLVPTFILICKNAVSRLMEPTMSINVSGVIFYLVLGVIALGSNVFFWFRSYRLAITAPSPGIEAQWRLFRVKAISNAFVVFSLALNIVLRAYSWAAYLDPALSLIVAAMILISAYKIFTRSVYDLLDGALEENIQLMIMRELAVHFDKYRDFHGVRSRRVGNRVLIELFLEFEPDRTMKEVQDNIEEMKSGMEKSVKGSQVIIVPSVSQVVSGVVGV
jgi:ferrous-iron efflux pump FieF